MCQTVSWPRSSRCRVVRSALCADANRRSRRAANARRCQALWQRMLSMPMLSTRPLSAKLFSLVRRRAVAGAELRVAVWHRSPGVVAHSTTLDPHLKATAFIVAPSGAVAEHRAPTPGGSRSTALRGGRTRFACPEPRASREAGRPLPRREPAYSPGGLARGRQENDGSRHLPIARRQVVAVLSCRATHPMNSEEKGKLLGLLTTRKPIRAIDSSDLSSPPVDGVRRAGGHRPHTTAGSASAGPVGHP